MSRIKVGLQKYKDECCTVKYDKLTTNAIFGEARDSFAASVAPSQERPGLP